jgi:prephenate dehydratase
MVKSGLTLGALGGPYTFNAQAAKRIVRCYPQFGEIIYFPTSDEVIQAVLRGHVKAACGQEQTSKDGFHLGMQARIATPKSQFYAVAEVAQAYHCSLLCKPGAQLDQVRCILGHAGSIAHSRAWLERNVPSASIEIVETSSMGAARAVLDGDGSIASVGSPDLANELGLAEMSCDIDEGSVVNYWAVSLEPMFDPLPDRLAIAGRFRGEPEMGRIICGLHDNGFDLHAIFPRATGAALYEYDYVFRFWGGGRLDDVQSMLSRFPCVRLAGAWRSSATSKIQTAEAI